MIFICVGTAIGIVFHDSKYYFFDPHARDKFGLPSESGKSILSVLENLSVVCVYLRKFASSLTASKPHEIQYDLHHIVFNKPKKKKYCKHHSAINIILVPYRVNCINSVKVNDGKRKRKEPIEENVYICKVKQAKLTEFVHDRLTSTEGLSETEYTTQNTGVSYTDICTFNVLCKKCFSNGITFSFQNSSL